MLKGKKHFFFLILLSWSIFANIESAFAQNDNHFVIEGTIDLSKNNLEWNEWPYAGHYDDIYKIRVTVDVAYPGPATNLMFGHGITYDEGSFRHDNCWTSIQFNGGQIHAELIDPKSENLISTITKPMFLWAYFSTPTNEQSECYPHDYPSFIQNLSFSWENIYLPISRTRKILIRPFAFLDPFTLWGKGYVEKNNGIYTLKSFSVGDGLRDDIYDSTLRRAVPALKYLPWDHFNSEHQMPFPGHADASGTTGDMQLQR